jgi:hypothetical protein
MWHAKPKKYRCNCRKRSRNNPKVGGGICHRFGYREAVVARIAARRLARMWLHAARGGYVDEFES